MENFINESIIGVILLFLGLAYLIYKLDKVRSSKKRNESIFTRVSNVQSWGIIIISIMSGIILILKNIK